MKEKTNEFSDTFKRPICLTYVSYPVKFYILEIWLYAVVLFPRFKNIHTLTRFRVLCVYDDRSGVNRSTANFKIADELFNQTIDQIQSSAEFYLLRSFNEYFDNFVLKQQQKRVFLMHDNVES